MSAYQKRKRDGAVQRWNPEEGIFVDVAPDEPWTRVRKPNEGMFVFSVDEFMKPGLPGDHLDRPVSAISYADLAKLHGIGVPDGVDGFMAVSSDPSVTTYEQAMAKLKGQQPPAST